MAFQLPRSSLPPASGTHKRTVSENSKRSRAIITCSGETEAQKGDRTLSHSKAVADESWKPA